MKIPEGITTEYVVQLLQKMAEMQRQIILLTEDNRLLRTQLYGRKSEKRRSVSGSTQLPLFDMPEPDWVEEPEGKEAEKKVPVASHERRRAGRKALPENLPRIEVVHDIPSEEKICACGSEMCRVGEEVSEQLDIIPATMQVVVNIRPKYACRNCAGDQSDGPVVKIAPPPPQIIPKSMASPGLLAEILTRKFVDHNPFYRQEKQFHRLGVDISRTSMCNWAMQVAEACLPLLNLLMDILRECWYLNIDETTLQVLAEPGRAPTTTSYMWVFRGNDPERPVLIFQYHPTRKGEVAKDVVDGFAGYIQTDGYSGYDFLDRNEEIFHLGCWAHARRMFSDVIKGGGKDRTFGSADVALNFIKELYRLESNAQNQKASFAEIYQMRQEHAKPILDKFKTWLDERAGKVLPKSLLGKAIQYVLNQWPRLILYLETGYLKIDNNLAENAIRPFVLGRKNWLFSGTPEGASASALLYSLIETAKANKKEPFAYLRHIFAKLPIASTLEDYEALLPWNVPDEVLDIENNRGRGGV